MPLNILILKDRNNTRNMATEDTNVSSNIKRVLAQAKYGPVPPPVSTPEIFISRRAATWDIDDYHDGYGPVFLPGTKTELLANQGLQLTHNFGTISKEDPRKIWSLLLSHLLNQNFSLDEGIWYLDQIYRSGKVLYHEKDLSELVNKWTSHVQRLEEDLILFGETGTKLGLFLPKHLLMTEGLPYFFFTSIYWLRARKLPTQLTPRNVYLITANPYERYPARKYLSHFDDTQLYLSLGRSENYYFPKMYSTKRQQLDGFVAFCLTGYGYYSVQSWSRPIQIVFNRPRQTVPLITEIDQVPISLEEIMSKPDIRALRLHLTVESSWPALKDKPAWNQFLDWGREILYGGKETLFYREFQEKLGLIQSQQVRDEFRSLEQNSDICLVCGNIRAEKDFALCGDPICSVCQSLLGTVQCPFCDEYFVCESINDQFIKSLRNPIGSRLNLQERIEEIKREKNSRRIKFS